MLNQVQIGPRRGNVTDVQVARAGRDVDTIVSALHGRYYETTRYGKMFNAANQVHVTVGPAGVNPNAYTGLAISNPPTSTVVAVLHRATIMQEVVQSATFAAFAVGIGFSTTSFATQGTLTPVAVQPCLVGSGNTGQVVAEIAMGASPAFPAALTYHTFVADTPTAAQDVFADVVDFEGSLILLPGAYAAWITPIASIATSMWLSFQWEEVPL